MVVCSWYNKYIVRVESFSFVSSFSNLMREVSDCELVYMYWLLSYFSIWKYMFSQYPISASLYLYIWHYTLFSYLLKQLKFSCRSFLFLLRCFTYYSYWELFFFQPLSFSFLFSGFHGLYIRIRTRIFYFNRHCESFWVKSYLLYCFFYTLSLPFCIFSHHRKKVYSEYSWVSILPFRICNYPIMFFFTPL